MLVLTASQCGVQRPIPLAGLLLWLKADAGVTLDGSTVSRWADQSGNDNDAIQPGSSCQPLFVKAGLNSEPVIRFDGFDDRLGLTGARRMSQISLFVVLKIDSGAPGTDHTPFAFGDINADGHVWGVLMQSGATGFSPDTVNVFAGRSSWVQASVPGCCTFGKWRIMSIVTDQVMWKTTVRADGADAQVSHDAQNVFISVPIGSPSGAGFGGIGGSGLIRQYAKCEVAEVILYDSVLSDSLRRSVESYLAAKYRILPGSGTQK